MFLYYNNCKNIKKLGFKFDKSIYGELIPSEVLLERVEMLG